MFGEDRLLNTLNTEELKNANTKDTLKKLKEALSGHVKNAEQSDDITMMSIIYNGVKNSDMEKKETKTLQVAATLENLDKVQNFVEETLAPLNISMSESLQIALSVEEIFVNIANYAYTDKEGDAKVEVSVFKERRGAEITFTDSGTQYDPLKKQDPNIEADIEDRSIGGLGIFLVKKNMDELEYVYENNQNKLTMRKYFA